MQFCKGFGATAKPFRIALGVLVIKGRLGLMEDELVVQIKKSLYLQFFIGLGACQYSVPFKPSNKVYSRKRLSEAVVYDCNDQIVRNGLEVIRSACSAKIR